MKKITLIGISAAMGMLMFALPALASTTASLIPASLKVSAGQQFNVVISVNPQGTSNYAEKLEIDYPADLLSVSSFTLGSNWMALTQPGYDSVDDNAGIIIKTAGYAGGLTSLTPFGTITFTAKKSGTGNITIGKGSLAFQSGSQGAITGTGSELVVTAATVTPKSVVPVDNVKTNDLAPVSSINGKVVVPTTTQDLLNAQTAAVANASSTGNFGNTLWIVVVLILVVIIVFLVVKRKKKSSF